MAVPTSSFDIIIASILSFNLPISPTVAVCLINHSSLVIFSADTSMYHNVLCYFALFFILCVK